MILKTYVAFQFQTLMTKLFRFHAMLSQDRPDVGPPRRNRSLGALRAAAIPEQSQPENPPQLVQRPQVRAHPLPRRHRRRRPRPPRG